MKIICRARQSGKTFDIIKRCSKESSYIVCHNRKEAERVHGMAKGMELDIPFPITFMYFVLRHYSPRIDKFHINNIDMCIQTLTQVEISTITLTSGKDNK